MTGFHRKLLTASIVLGSAAALLAWAGLKQGWVYYMSVDEFAALHSSEQQRVRLYGVAGENNFEVAHAGLWARFDLHGDYRVLRVEYKGVIPDMFHPGHEVIVEGRLNERGVFVADTLMTKCGSRYESEGGASHPDPRSADAAANQHRTDQPS